MIQAFVFIEAEPGRIEDFFAGAMIVMEVCCEEFASHDLDPLYNIAAGAMCMA